MSGKRWIHKRGLNGLFPGRGRRIMLALLLTMTIFFTVIYMGLKLLIMQQQNADSRLGQPELAMPVIIGHYFGGRSNFKLTPELLNANNFDPDKDAGAEGRPVLLSPSEVINGKNYFGLHGYNILAGDKIPLDRTLPDMRSPECVAATNLYLTASYPKASVIIVFHNEAFSTLMRTVTSVLNRTPGGLLEEIILVDDASDRLYLFKELEDAITFLASDHNTDIRIERIKTREGIVRARMAGATIANGEILIFLDAHCEVTQGWVEPLIDRAKEKDAFVSPSIDLISDDTFAYIKSAGANWGVFSRRLHFRWMPPNKETMLDRFKDPAQPFPTPVMAGGLFAVSSSLFFRLGGYDEGMLIWGGENLEVSWRAWQCGAKVLISPCSRVGHVFRKFSPYTFPGGVKDILSANLARAATVWMDEWSDYICKFNPTIAEARSTQNVTSRKLLKKKLQCKSFEWYLKTVWPDHFHPSKENWFGRIRNGLGACLGFENDGSPNTGGLATGIECGADLNIDKLVVYTDKGFIMADDGICLQEGSVGIIWKACSGSDRQIWTQEGPKIQNLAGLCLTLLVPSSDPTGVGVPLSLKKCEPDVQAQIWKFERIPWT